MNIVIVILSICVAILLVLYIKNKRYLKKEFDKFLKKKEDDIRKHYNTCELEAETHFLAVQKEVKFKIQELKDEEMSFKDSIHKERLQLQREFNEERNQLRANLDKENSEIRNAFTKQKNDLDLLISQGKEIVDEKINAYKVERTNAAEKQYYEKCQYFDNLLEEHKKKIELDMEETSKELVLVRKELDEFHTKRAAINESIRLEREMNEKADFYRIKLSDADIEDIHYILSMVGRVQNKEALSKLIWSEYLSKPFNQMIKNVCGGIVPKNVIYMITNLETKEVYIGKTKGEVSKRWTEHIKSSLGIGTISHSRIHEALYKNWSNFTFQILEKVDTESNLSEREKYYINFYKSNIYGYNITSGG